MSRAIRRLSRTTASCHGTIVSVSESLVLPGIVWAGTDDGNLRMSKDSCDVHRGRKEHARAARESRLLDLAHRRSHFDAGTAYVAVDGHRDDDLKPYLFRHPGLRTALDVRRRRLLPSAIFSRARGSEEPQPVRRQRVRAPHPLDGGRKWQKFMNNLPTARVDDILVHPRDSDLVVATHARGIWIADDISPLQQLAASERFAQVAGALVVDAPDRVARPLADPVVHRDRERVGHAARGAGADYYLRPQRRLGTSRSPSRTPQDVWCDTRWHH